jgi:hypothetical protein
VSDLNLEAVLSTIETKGTGLERLSGKRILSKRNNVEIYLGISGDEKLHLLFSPVGGRTNEELKSVQLKNLSCTTKSWAVENSPARDYIDLSCPGNDQSPIKKPFLAFGEDIIKHIESSTDAPDLAIKRVFRRWKRFWSGGETSLPSQEWIRGLFGELLFLDKLLRKHGLHSLSRWQGPRDKPHDFSGDTIAFEIKTSQTRPATIHIHSLSQLDNTRWSALYLVLYRLEESQSGASLCDLVRRVEQHLEKDETLLDEFWELLALAGYRRDQEHYYAKSTFLDSDPLIFEVDDAFPKLTRKDFNAALDPRVFDIRYSIELSGLSPIPATNEKLRSDLGSMAQAST